MSLNHKVTRKDNYIYSLTREDLSNIGAPMGREYSTTDWIKLFSSIHKAKKYAQKDYDNIDGREKFEWTRKYGEWNSGDLLSKMYTIRKVVIDEE